ncbi:hypothetical protein QFC22_006012 [Naganishia vaughanmartiniae]|uniref:Uncharacterized protein n=1 Tax=Naganishia vaughanmartiniae TaxID=1424756 RepID=A0ACC2WNX9_9TREE|nr:hypothetical protein QFC22_006012 [Naganishia vaughanmartiniae]
MAAVAYVYDTRSAVHEHVAMPVLRAFTDAETSHKLAVKMLSMASWVRPKDRGTDAERIRTDLFGLPLNNPIGLAAGFDKDAQAIDGLFDLGFAYIEVGSITPEPQAINLGKNKSSPTQSNADYVAGVRLLGPYADILVINVSSPNTPGLRGLQGKSYLANLLQDVVRERDHLHVPPALKPKIVVKIAPDLDEQEIEDIAAAIRSSGVDGAIVSNTTVKREGLDLQSVHASETGGLSGKPVKSLSLLTLSALRALLPTSIPIIGCGGISNGNDAVDFLNAGADMVQAYTAFGYTGVGFARKVKDEIAANLERHSTTWKAEVEKNRQKWADVADHLEQQLKAEVSRLRQARDSAPSLIPAEDLAAAAGLDSEDLSATREDSSHTFGSVRAVAQGTHADPAGTVSMGMHNLDASLRPFVSAVLGVSDGVVGLQDELPHAHATNGGAHSYRAADPAETPLAETLSWRNSVNQGDRRLV